MSKSSNLRDSLPIVVSQEAAGINFWQWNSGIQDLNRDSSNAQILKIIAE